VRPILNSGFRRGVPVRQYWGNREEEGGYHRCVTGVPGGGVIVWFSLLGSLGLDDARIVSEGSES